MLEETEESRSQGTLRNNRAQDIAIFISAVVFSRTTLDIKFITLLD